MRTDPSRITEPEYEAITEIAGPTTIRTAIPEPTTA